MDSSINELFREYDGKIEAITQKSNQFLATFVTKIPFPDHISRNYELRDSIQYRLNSLVFHFHWMIKSQAMIANTASKQLVSGQPFNDGSFIHSAEQETLFLFDNVIFNVISLFDYVGNLIGNVYERERIRKWPGICNAARGSNSFSKHAIARLIIGINKDWVDHLYKYRSDLIHGEKAATESIQQFNFTPGRSEVQVLIKVPQKFAKIVKAYRRDCIEHGKTHILDAVEWLTTKSMDSVLEIVSKMHSDFSKAGAAHN